VEKIGVHCDPAIWVPCTSNTPQRPRVQSPWRQRRTKNGNKELKNRNGKVSIVNADLRIGYGLCASACPADAIALNRRDESIEPPANIRELYLKMAEEKGRVEAFMGNLA
jgi:ferredoxin